MEAPGAHDGPAPVDDLPDRARAHRVEEAAHGGRDVGGRRDLGAGARLAGGVAADGRARPSEHVAVFVKKYLAKWEKIEQEAAAAPAETPPPAQA